MLKRFVGRRLPARLAQLRAERERGSASAELVVATPLLLLLVMAVIQFALYYHGAEAAQAAASQAVEAARAQGASTAAGQAQGQAILDQVAGGSLPERAITVTRAAGDAQATVTGTVESLIPGLTLHVTAHAAAPLEAWSGN
jgi:Flp pilus assembly protein TadG